ncbi:MAG: type II toxin-antitoxin system RelE/ParE family toxin [Terriglobales bacterium]
MTRAAVEVHPQAADEAEAAVRWYRERSETAADALLNELERAVELISKAPDRWSIYIGDTRRFLLHRFPFSIFYCLSTAGKSNRGSCCCPRATAPWLPAGSLTRRARIFVGLRPAGLVAVLTRPLVRCRM